MTRPVTAILAPPCAEPLGTGRGPSESHISVADGWSGLLDDDFLTSSSRSAICLFICSIALPRALGSNGRPGSMPRNLAIYSSRICKYLSLSMWRFFKRAGRSGSDSSSSSFCSVIDTCCPLTLDLRVPLLRLLALSSLLSRFAPAPSGNRLSLLANPCGVNSNNKMVSAIVTNAAWLFIFDPPYLSA